MCGPDHHQAGADALAHRLLVVEDHPRTVSAQAATWLAGAAVRSVSWDTLADDWRQADVVVAVLAADHDPRRIGDVLPAMARTVGVLVVVPEGAPAALLRIAQEAADFIVSPVRPAELCQRLERVAGRRTDAEVGRRLADDLGLSQLVEIGRAHV